MLNTIFKCDFFFHYLSTQKFTFHVECTIVSTLCVLSSSSSLGEPSWDQKRSEEQNWKPLPPLRCLSHVIQGNKAFFSGAQ